MYVMVQRVVNIMGACTVYNITEMHLRLTLSLDSDSSGCFNHRDKLNSAVQLPNFRSVVARYTLPACML
jgi:hypothetical protein